ncbi:MAG: O-antigen ligase family protein [Lachnospiraceae bacterium]|nr:O-antigen ligase family protein [Lachnospiraceae bacterium]
MYINKQESLIWLLLLLQLTPLLRFNGLIIAVAVLLFYSFLHVKTIIKNSYPSKSIVLSVIALGLINTIYCLYTYRQGLADGIFGIYYLGLFISYFLFVRYFKRDISRIDKLNELVMIIAAVVSMMTILQSLFYPYINVFSFSVRNGRMRILGTAMSFFAEILGIAYWMTGRATKRMKISLTILIFALFFVSQSRSGIILLFVACAFAEMKRLLEKKSKRSIFMLLGFAIGLFVVVVLISKTTLWNQVFSFMDEIEEGSGSGATRMREMSYYWNQLKGKEIFGLGLLRGGSVLADSVFRTDLYFFIEDLGLLGFVFQTGYLGLAWVVYAIISILKNMSRLAKVHSQISVTIRLSFTMLLIITLIGFTNANYIVGRSSIFFFCMLLAEVDVLLAEADYDS